MALYNYDEAVINYFHITIASLSNEDLSVIDVGQDVQM